MPRQSPLRQSPRGRSEPSTTAPRPSQAPASPVQMNSSPSGRWNSTLRDRQALKTKVAGSAAQKSSMRYLYVPSDSIESCTRELTSDLMRNRLLKFMPQHTQILCLEKGELQARCMWFWQIASTPARRHINRAKGGRGRRRRRQYQLGWRRPQRRGRARWRARRRQLQLKICRS